MISFIKNQLPTDRKRLTHLIPYSIDDELRDDDDPLHHHSLPITDPVEMANHIALYWGKLWAKGTDPPSPEAILGFLSGYLRRVPQDCLPTFPNLSHQAICPALDMSWSELVDRAIAGSNDSTPGPDGIPFAAYRALPEICAPFLLEIIIDCAQGGSPPAGFNHGRLFLIPKDDSYKVLSTRPIVVNNSDNRLVAKVMAAVMTPAAQFIIHPSQKGFVEGRVGAENVESLSESFYLHLQHKQQLHILQIDTRKAFDSIHHDYILLILSTVGFPSWLTQIVAALLSDVYVLPVVASQTSVLIPIHRGVKQGCPLSPLLFVLAYDPLLWSIHAIVSHEHDPSTFAFADDLAIAAAALATLFLCMTLITTFSKISGLGVNEDKSRLTSTKPYSRAENSLLPSSPWPDVTYTKVIKYLGIPIGRGVTTELVFESPLRKLATRARLYAPTLKSLPLHLRIVAVNVFLFSLFSYHGQFYMPGSAVTDRYNSTIGPLVGPFRGTALALVHLFAGPKSGLYGLRSPLKNLWAWSIATLAGKFDLPALHNSSATSLSGFEELDDPGWLSMRVSLHIAGSARDMLNHFLRSPAGLVDSATLRQHSPLTRSLLYNRALALDLLPVIHHPTNPGSLCTRLKRWDLGPSDAERLRARWTQLPSSLPPHYFTHHLLMLFWALPTDERLSKCDGLTFSDPRPFPSYLSCYLCSSFSPHSPMDSVSHLYSGSCLVGAAARARFFGLLRLPDSFSIPHSLLLSPTPLPSLISTRKLYVNATLFFNLHLYSLRARLFKPLTHPPLWLRLSPYSLMASSSNGTLAPGGERPIPPSLSPFPLSLAHLPLPPDLPSPLPPPPPLWTPS
jgi:hypothetical protein